MKIKERRQKILDTINETGYMKISDIEREFHVSNETARRDLDYLVTGKQITRVLGGAIPLTADAKTIPVPAPGGDRTRSNRILSAISAAALSLVNPGDTIYLGHGSTVRALASRMKSLDNVTVVTSSLHVLNELADSKVTLYTLGGLFSEEEHHLLGDMAMKNLMQFHFSKTFIGCGGVVPEIGVMDYGHLGINLLTESLQRARERILLAASYKFGIETFMHVCSVSDLDVIVTDNRLSRDYVEQLREMGVRVILVNPANHAVTLDTKLRA